MQHQNDITAPTFSTICRRGGGVQDIFSLRLSVLCFALRFITFFERTHLNATVKREKPILNYENNSNPLRGRHRQRRRCARMFYREGVGS